MTPQRIVIALVAALAAALSLADDETAATRSEYDAFMSAFTLEQHRVSCEHHAPSVYATFSAQVATWRTNNQAALRRWEPAARRWRLPGDRSMDALLAHIAASMDEYYASTDQETTDARCKQLLERLQPLTMRWSGP